MHRAQNANVRVDIVLPCLNEVAALPWVLSRVPLGVRAIVVDNGSTDGSAELARSWGAEVVTCTDRGYGAACHAGLMAAQADVVAVCDCDASLDPGDALRLATALEHGADLVVGRRRPVSFAAWPLHARLANRELARRVRRRTGAAIRDVGPLRVSRRSELIALAIVDRRCGYPVETLVRAARAGWRIEQIDVEYTPRLGRSKVTGTVLGTARAIRDMSQVLTA
jgi:glycosyltransferase involved in cell wall biosynthesis